MVAVLVVVYIVTSCRDGVSVTPCCFAKISEVLGKEEEKFSTSFISDFFGK
jgi:hypothetical protein